MNQSKLSRLKWAGVQRPGRRVTSAAALLVAVSLAACGGASDKKPGQSLARVDGEEITVLQLNEELQRAGVQQQQQQQASKQLLESLIDRQLLLNAALKEKLDRDPKVAQSVERAKALIVAQFYLQKKIGTPAKPTKEEVQEYYAAHPEFFAQRKVFDLRQLVLASKDLDDTMRAAIDKVKTVDEVAALFDAHQIKYARSQLSRATSDLPPQLAAKLTSLGKGQLFIIREGERSLVNSIVDTKDSPVALEAAAPQIEQFLANKKAKDAADVELKRLRAAAKIEMLQKAAPDAPAASAAAAATPDASADVNARGVSGLK